MRDDDLVLKITGAYQMDELNRDVWEMVSVGLKELRPMMTSDHIPPVQTEDVQQLKLGGALLQNVERLSSYIKCAN